MDNSKGYKDLPLRKKNNSKSKSEVIDTEEANSDILVRFGKTVRSLRSSLEMTQEDLAVKAGLHRNYISDMERGTRNVSLKAISKVAMALNVDERDLF
ncbi:MAG: helix-turn-helix transcriptional regulator [Erysipelotrichaceae bacterium]